MSPVKENSTRYLTDLLFNRLQLLVLNYRRYWNGERMLEREKTGPREGRYHNCFKVWQNMSVACGKSSN